jgi:anti-sigma regulatory factor (Ser/Thr protein kinase)
MKKEWPAVIDSVPDICTWVLAEARETGFSEREAERWMLAVEEVTVNIVHYAYRDGPVGKIAVDVNRSASGMTIGISDSGRPFNPLSAPDPAIHTPLEKRAIGGLGIFLARKVVDRIHYERRAGRNILTLRKQLP